jgi:hypothetical protein
VVALEEIFGVYPAPVVLAKETLFLGDQLLAWLVLALGGAMVVGNTMALVRPPKRVSKGDLERAPAARSITMIAIGAVATVWAIASLAAH